MIGFLPIGIVVAILVFAGPHGCTSSGHHGKNRSLSFDASQQGNVNRTSPDLILPDYGLDPDAENVTDSNPNPNPGPDPGPETHQVPGPVGIVGAAVSWRLSKKLRRRVKKAQ